MSGHKNNLQHVKVKPKNVLLLSDVIVYNNGQMFVITSSR